MNSCHNEPIAFFACQSLQPISDNYIGELLSKTQRSNHILSNQLWVSWNKRHFILSRNKFSKYQIKITMHRSTLQFVSCFKCYYTTLYMLESIQFSLKIYLLISHFDSVSFRHFRFAWLTKFASICFIRNVFKIVCCIGVSAEWYTHTHRKNNVENSECLRNPQEASGMRDVDRQRAWNIDVKLTTMEAKGSHAIFNRFISFLSRWCSALCTLENPLSLGLLVWHSIKAKILL